MHRTRVLPSETSSRERRRGGRIFPGSGRISTTSICRYWEYPLKPARTSCGARSAMRSSASSRLSMRSEEHTSELQSLMRISYAVFCLKKKNHHHVLNDHL